MVPMRIGEIEDLSSVSVDLDRCRGVTKLVGCEFKVCLLLDFFYLFRSGATSDARVPQKPMLVTSS